jgi:16S rRNA (uracil1498-N3)-methyltransferase
VITLLVDPSRFEGGREAPGGPPAGGDEPAGRPDHPELLVEGDAYRHLFRARRLAVGDRLRVVDGGGRARWGHVIRVGRSAGIVALGEPAADNEPRLRVELLVPTLRPERAAWLVEKATELGAVAVRFLNTERAPRSFGGGTVERLRRVAGAAVEQCHRSRCPDLSGPHPFADVVNPGPLCDPAARRWLLDPAAPDLERSPPPPAAHPTESLLVGPEGGWAPAELEALEAAGWHRTALGPRILRVETAALAAATLLLLPPLE